MKILAISFVYNEAPYLPTAISWYRNQGIEDFYVIDNCSRDTTRDWLRDNNIPHHSVDTGNSFHLRKLQNSMLTVLHRLKPDWYVRFDADLFHVFDKSIPDIIESADVAGYNMIKSPCFSIKNTGEVPGLPLYKHYRYGVVNNNVRFISKYHADMEMSGDKAQIAQPNILETGYIFEYGTCKPAEVQIEKLERRRQAWAEGVNKCMGSHYLKGEARNWVYELDFPGMEDVWRAGVPWESHINKLKGFPGC